MLTPTVVSGRPEHHWIGYTPAMRIKSHVTGDSATHYFECLWMDVDSNAIGAHAGVEGSLVSVDGARQAIRRGSRPPRVARRPSAESE